MLRRMAIMAMAITVSMGTGAAVSSHATAATITAGSVAASRLTPALSAAKVPFCLILPHNAVECIKSNGGGNQVTLTNQISKAAIFHRVSSSTSGGIFIENAAGNCLRAATNFKVTIENGACDVHDARDAWTLGTTPGILNSVEGKAGMLTHGHATGAPVWHEAFKTGDWHKWQNVDDLR